MAESCIHANLTHRLYLICSTNSRALIGCNICQVEFVELLQECSGSTVHFRHTQSDAKLKAAMQPRWKSDCKLIEDSFIHT